MESFFALLQSDIFQICLVIVWIGSVYFWQQQRLARTNYAKVGVLAFVSLLTVTAEFADLRKPASPIENIEGEFSPVDISDLILPPGIDFDLDLNAFEEICVSSPSGVENCFLIPKLIFGSCRALGEVGSCIDKQSLISALKTTSYAFNRIDEMTLGEPETVSLIIDTSGAMDIEQELDGLSGNVITGETPISFQMEAELVGPAFKIEPVGRQRREISTLNPTRWEWDITPERPGKHPLEVSLYVVVTNEGEKISEDKPLAERQVIDVTVSRLDSLIIFAEKLDPLRAFVFALIASLVGLLGWFGIKSWKDVSGKGPEEEKPQRIEVTIKDGSDNSKDRKTDE